MNRLELHNRIDSFTELEYNWDSYEALPITCQSILTAHCTLDKLIIDEEDSELIRVYPMRDGGVQFEIGDYKEIEILDSNVEEILYDGNYNKLR